MIICTYEDQSFWLVIPLRTYDMQRFVMIGDILGLILVLFKLIMFSGTLFSNFVVLMSPYTLHTDENSSVAFGLLENVTGFKIILHVIFLLDATSSFEMVGCFVWGSSLQRVLSANRYVFPARSMSNDLKCCNVFCRVFSPEETMKRLVDQNDFHL